jgi:hypothetical protein
VQTCIKVTGYGGRCPNAEIRAWGRELVGNARHKFYQRGTKRQKYFRKNFSFLNFWRGWWKISCRYFAGEIGIAVRAVTEGLVGGMAAAAKSDGGASGKAEFISGEIDDFKIAFH